MTTEQATTTRAEVIPVLVYEDIEAAHDFLVGTFGFTSGGLHRTEDGTVVRTYRGAGRCGPTSGSARARVVRPSR